MDIKNAYMKRPEYEGEDNSGEELVETSGYISAEVQIENMILAGERLDEYRRQMYDYPEGLKEGEEAKLDPTRRKGFDVIDAQREVERIKRSLKDEEKKGNKDKPVPAEIDERKDEVSLPRQQEEKENSSEG